MPSMRSRPSPSRSRTARHVSSQASAQWELERARIQALVGFLESRRALYFPGARLNEGDVRISLRKIVDECTWCLEQIDAQSESALHLQEITNACRYFIDRSKFSCAAEFYMTLGALRLIIADLIAKLSAAYDVSEWPAAGLMLAHSPRKESAVGAGCA